MEGWQDLGQAARMGPLVTHAGGHPDLPYVQNNSRIFVAGGAVGKGLGSQLNTHFVSKSFQEWDGCQNRHADNWDISAMQLLSYGGNYF